MSQYKQGPWSLGDLMEEFTPDAADKAIADMGEAATALEARRDALRADIPADEFYDILGLLEEFASRARVIQAYAALRFSADTGDQEALAFMGRVEQAVTEARNSVMFLELWLRALDDDNSQRLREAAGDLAYYITQERLFKDHTLSEPEEKLITLKDINGINAIITLYDMITNAYSFTIKVDGKDRTMSRDELAAYVRDPDPAVREAAYREQYRVYGKDAPVLGQAYINRVRDWANEHVTMRGIVSPIAVRNLENDIPHAVVSTLLDVCASEAKVFHDYFRLKAGWLKMDRLRRFDIYAPVSTGKARRIPYPEAVTRVLASFKRFSPWAAAMAERVLREDHLDSELRPGKRGGAFCYSVLPGQSPWVLLNYTGEPREVSTMAHELGHAIHSMAAEAHSVLTFGSSLPLAETASVFSEMLLMDYMLENEQDPTVRRDILIEAVDGMYATVLRQAFFVMFEQAAHVLALGGRTVDDLSEVYMQNLYAQFGRSVEVDDIFRHEWTSIPHIYHAPFYCYAYSFGMLLSLALYDRYRREGDAFAPVFMRILAHGGAKSTTEVLMEAGVDMTDEAFWRGGFRVISDTIGRLV